MAHDYFQHKNRSTLRLLIALYLWITVIPGIGTTAQHTQSIPIGYELAHPLAEIPQTLFDQLAQALHTYQLDVEFVPLDHPDTEIWFTLGQETITLHAETRFLQARSPLLLDSVENRLDPLAAPLQVQFATAYVLYALGEHALAYESFATLLEQDSLGLAAFYLGNLALFATDDHVAAQFYESYLSTEQTIFGRQNLAWTYIQLGRADDAIELVDSAIQQITDQSATCDRISLLQLRAELQALLFDYTQSIVDFEQAIELAEDSTCPALSLAQLYTGQARIVLLTYEWDRVLTLLNHALEIDPHYAPAYFERGVLFYTMTQRQQALADFTRVMSLAPDSPHARQSAIYIESIRTELQALRQP